VVNALTASAACNAGCSPVACQAQNRTTIPSKSGDGSHTLRLTGGPRRILDFLKWSHAAATGREKTKLVRKLGDARPTVLTAVTDVP